MALAAVITLGAIALASSSGVQQQPSEQTPAATSPPHHQNPPKTQGTQNPSVAPPEAPVRPYAQSNEPEMPTGKTQNPERSFNGRIVRENGKLLLKNPATKKTYEFDNVSKVSSFIGKEVRLTGRRDPTSNRIHVDKIVPAS